MKVLVTGANGYVGSKVVKRLLDLKLDVVAVDFSDNNIDKRATFFKEDIFGKKNYFELFGHPDVCLHLAWKDGFIHNSYSHLEQLSDHYIFIKNLINDGIKQVCVMGSMHEVGYYEGKIDENTPTNPLTNYAIAKDALRRGLEVLCRDKGVVFQWTRGFYIYGDDDFGNSIFCKIRQADREGKKLFPFTSGKNKFDFINIYELANQLCCVVMQKEVSGIINICSGVPVSLGEQIEKYIKDNNLKITLDYGKFPERPFESPCLYGDTGKIKKILGNL